MKLKHLYLAVTKNAMRWHESNKHLHNWADLKADFLNTFLKTRVDFDIVGQSSRLLASEDPVVFVFQVLNVVNTTSPNATEAEKVNRLFAELPIHMKPGFVRSPPQSVRSFTERMRDLSREAAYVRTSMLQAGLIPELSPTQLPGLNPSIQKSKTVSFAGLPATTDKEMTALIDETYKDREFKQMQEKITDLTAQIRHARSPTPERWSSFNRDVSQVGMRQYDFLLNIAIC